MKLSPEAQKYVDFLYEKAINEINMQANAEFSRLRRWWGPVPKRQYESSVRTRYYQYINNLVLYKVRAYIKVYKMDNKILDSSDIDEILTEIKVLLLSLKSPFDFLLPPPQFPGGKPFINTETEAARNILSKAGEELETAMYETALNKESKAHAAEKIDNLINIQGNNYGPIQQGGQNNTQNFNQDKEDETK